MVLPGVRPPQAPSMNSARPGGASAHAPGAPATPIGRAWAIRQIQPLR